MAHRGALAILLAICSVLLAADPAPAQTPKRGGVIRIAEREAPGLDPHLTISFLTRGRGARLIVERAEPGLGDGEPAAHLAVMKRR